MLFEAVHSNSIQILGLQILSPSLEVVAPGHAEAAMRGNLGACTNYSPIDSSVGRQRESEVG